MKIYRRGININGSQKKSPRFHRKADADHWYHTQYRIKQALRDGISLPIDNKTTVSEYVLTTWLPNRKKRYPGSTTGPDEQRFADYVEPIIGTLRVCKVTQLHIRLVLKQVVEKHGRSIETRNRVRSLVSKIFNDALNEDPPLRADNPALNISFDDPRIGKKRPKFIKSEEDILSFLKAAKGIGPTSYVYASIALMAGLRKQEIIPLQWNDFSEKTNELTIDQKFNQWENRIVTGTKSGQEEIRVVPIPDALVKVLKWHWNKTEFAESADFILSRKDGAYIPAREMSTIHQAIKTSSGVDIHPHGLRHTFGREFALKSGNMKVLQSILGHTNSSTTEIYSELSGRSLSKHKNTVSFNIGDEDENDQV